MLRWKLCFAALTLFAAAASPSDMEDAQRALDRKDYATAFKLIRPLADHGRADAQNKLASIYQYGLGVTKNYTEAVKWYRMAAEQDDAYGQTNLGSMYLDGLGVTKDYTEALKWFRKAGEQNNVYGQHNLGYMHQYGLGVTKDYAEAVKWYRKAAEQNYAPSQYNLGSMYQFGLGVARDEGEAKRLFQLVASNPTAPDDVKQMAMRKVSGTATPASAPQSSASAPPKSDQKDLAAELTAIKEQLAQMQASQKPATMGAAPSTPASTQRRRLALVIGNANYKIGRLANPTNDADDISRILRSAGFQVIDKRDATKADLVSAVREFGDRLLANDVGLVYYSGHALELKGRNYLIPVDADIRDEDEVEYVAFDANRVLDKMDTAKKDVNILIVDACRDNPFARSFRSGSRGLAIMDAPAGTLIAFSTSPGKTASDGNGRNSPYTRNLLKALPTPGLPIEQAFKRVRRAVQQETKGEQTPWEVTSLVGDFYFVR